MGEERPQARHREAGGSFHPEEETRSLCMPYSLSFFIVNTLVPWRERLCYFQRMFDHGYFVCLERHSVQSSGCLILIPQPNLIVTELSSTLLTVEKRVVRLAAAQRLVSSARQRLSPSPLSTPVLCLAPAASPASVCLHRCVVVKHHCNYHSGFVNLYGVPRLRPRFPLVSFMFWSL